MAIFNFLWLDNSLLYIDYCIFLSQVSVDGPLGFFPSAFKIFCFDIYFNNLIMMYFCMGSFFKKIMLIFFFFFLIVLGLRCCVGFYLVVVRGIFSSYGA